MYFERDWIMIAYNKVVVAGASMESAILGIAF